MIEASLTSSLLRICNAMISAVRLWLFLSVLLMVPSHFAQTSGKKVVIDTSDSLSKLTTIEPPDGHYVPEGTIKLGQILKTEKRITTEEGTESELPDDLVFMTKPNYLDNQKEKDELLDETVINTDQSNLENTLETRLITLAAANVLLSFCCIVISGFMMYYRIKTSSTKSLVNVLYIANGLADFFVGIGYLLQSPIIYLMILKGKDTSGATVPVFLSYFVTSVAVKMSVFLNCVLGVVRCINIVQPFYKPNKKVLSLSITFNMIIWMFILSLDIWQFFEKGSTKNQVFLVKTFLLKGQPGFGLVLLTMKKDQERSSYLAYHLGNLIQFIIPTAFPTLLCFVLMIIQLYHMPRKSWLKKIRKTVDGNETVPKANLTIFLITCIYVITSGASVVTWLIIHGRDGYFVSKSEFEIVMKNKRAATSWSDLITIYFSLSTCPLICSTLTPLTLLLRGTGPAISGIRKLFIRTSETL